MSPQQHYEIHPASVALEAISKRYPGASGQEGTLALDNLDLSISQSEIVAVLGPTGCGKSTVLNLIAGFEAPSGGRVLLDGQPLSGPGPDRAIVFQQTALFPWLNVFDNVTLGAKACGMDRQRYTADARFLLDEVGLSGFERHYPYQLSGGMQQRVQIARALLARPQLLLMDEPFGALDHQTRIQMHELLLRLWQEHKPTIFFITHDVSEAIFVADRVLVFSPRPGRIVRTAHIKTSKPRSQDFLSSEEFVYWQRELLLALQPAFQAADTLLDS